MCGGSIIELIDRDEALDLDEELVGLARSQTAVRLAIGEGFVALGKGWQELGFSTFAGYVRERCARSGRWGEETRTLALRLAKLPRIRERLLSGAMGWCMAELLARHATSDDEEELLEATRGMTVREVRRALRERGGMVSAADEEARFGTLDVSVTLEEAWLLEATRPTVELLDGRGEPGAWLESVLAEAQCALSNVAPGVELAPDDVAERQAAWLASIAAGEERLDRREARAEGRLPPMPAMVATPVVDELPDTAIGIDRVLARELAPRLASCDVRFGALLSRFFRARGWHVLGFASEKQYAHERLGMSRSAVHARIALARRVLHLEVIGDALADGSIGYEAATLIARVATPDTQAEWIERGRRRTAKHLREEVSAAELIARMMRLDALPGPPSQEEVAIVQALERDMKSGAYARRTFGIERDDDAPARIDAALKRAPSSTYAEMAKSALAVQEALRSVIATARTRAGSLSADEAESACTDVVGPEGELPVIDLEEAVVPVHATGASVVQMSAGERSAAVEDEVELPVHAAGASVVQMSACEPSAAAEGGEGNFVQMSACETSADAEDEVVLPVHAAGASVVQMSAGERSAGAEDEVVCSLAACATGASVVQMSAGEPSAAVEDEVVCSVAACPTGASVVQMSAGGSSAAVEEGVVQMSARELGVDVSHARQGGVQMPAENRRWGKVTLRIRAREETILHYRLLKAAYERSGMGGSFVQFMVLAFWSSWAEMLGRTNACESILRRDGYECTCPVCTRESAPGSHHVRFRSHGGGDEDVNLTSPCDFCHLDGVHGGRLKVTGEAPDLVWRIGRTPIMEVRGRERRLVA